MSPFTTIPFRMEISGRFPHLYRFIVRLERSDPVVVIDRVHTAFERENALRISLECHILTAYEGLEEEGPGGTTRVVFQPAASGLTIPESKTVRDIFAFASDDPWNRTITPKVRVKPQPINDAGIFHLSAILYDGLDSLALLNGTPIHIGDRYQGYNVVSIEKDRIHLERNNRTFQIYVSEH